MEGISNETRSIAKVVTGILGGDNPSQVLVYLEQKLILQADLIGFIEHAPIDLMHRIISSQERNPDSSNLKLLSFILNETAFNPFKRNPKAPPYESALEMAIRLQLNSVIQLFVEQDLLIIESNPEKPLRLPSQVVLNNCLIIGNISHPGQHENLLYNWKTLRQKELPDRRKKFSRRFKQFLEVYPDSPTSQFIDYLIQQLEGTADIFAVPTDFLSSRKVINLLEDELAEVTGILDELQAIAKKMKAASYGFVPPVIAALCLGSPLAVLGLCCGCLRSSNSPGLNVAGESIIPLLLLCGAFLIIGPTVYLFLIIFPWLVAFDCWSAVCNFLGTILENLASTTIPNVNTAITAITAAGSSICYLELTTVSFINIFSNAFQYCRQKVMETELLERLESFKDTAITQMAAESLSTEETAVIPNPTSEQILGSSISFYKEHYSEVRKSLAEKKDQLPQSKRLEFYSKTTLRGLLFATAPACEISLENLGTDLQLI